MKYAKGTIGRVFVARLEEGESIYDCVREIAESEGIKTAGVWAVGGMRSGKVVCGPASTEGKIVPNVEEFADAREIVGFGTIFPENGKPSLHFHAAIGRKDEAIVGCPRIEMSVYLILEVVIVEMLGIDAARVEDPEFGVNLLKILG